MCAPIYLYCLLLRWTWFTYNEGTNCYLVTKSQIVTSSVDVAALHYCYEVTICYLVRVNPFTITFHFTFTFYFYNLHLLCNDRVATLHFRNFWSGHLHLSLSVSMYIYYYVRVYIARTRAYIYPKTCQHHLKTCQHHLKTCQHHLKTCHEHQHCLKLFQNHL